MTSHQTDLSKKVVVIIGGTGGIGQATAKRFAALGARIVLVDRSNNETLEKLASSLPGNGHGGVNADILNSDSLKACAAEVLRRWGRADILINSAGFTKAIAHADLETLSDDLIDQLFAVNWRGQFATIRAFAPLLKEHGDGLVVNLSSIAGTTAVGSNVAYCAIKAGMDSMASTLGRALAPHIRVLNVAPGVVDTTFVPGRDATANERLALTTPLKRVGQTEDIAKAIEACATTLTFCTGTVIQVDGGRHLGLV